MATRTKKAVKANGRERTGRVGRVVVMVVLLAAAGLTYVWSAGRVTAMGYEISELEHSMIEAEELNRKLQVELASLTRADRVEQIAVKRLGMISPSAGQVVVIR